MSTSGIYERFLRGSGNVKVFSTDSNARPVEVPKRILRRSFPLLMASMLCMNACAVESTKNCKQYFDTINKENTISYGSTEFDILFTDTLNFYELNNLRETEPLSDEFIAEILRGDNLPLLDDFNYNHMPASNDNFWEIVRNGVNICCKDVQNSSNLTSSQKTMYKIMANKMLTQISKIKGTECEVDLSNYKNLKSILFFEKVIKYKDNYDAVIKQKEGVIDEKIEIFGCKYQDFDNFYKMASSDSDILAFSNSLYLNSNKDRMLSTEYSDLYNKESLDFLDKWLKEQKIEDEGLYQLSCIDNSVYCNSVAFYYKRGKDLRIKLDIDKNGNLGNGGYAPVGEIVIHELLHIMQRKPSSAELPEDNELSRVEGRRFSVYDDFIDEIGPTLMSITVNDYLYKKAHNINQYTCVDYGDIVVKGKKVKIGELALWFGDVIKRYGDRNEGVFSVDKMLSHPVVFNELKQIANGNVPLYQRVTQEYTR